MLLTGATGYIGRHVLARLLAEDFRVTLILRRRKGLLEGRLAHFFDAFPELRSLNRDHRLTVLEGDVSQAGCGLGSQAIADLTGNIDAFVHCAGMTCFDEDKESEICSQNTDGVRHAFELCQKLKIKNFHHVSTAFVAGNYPFCFSSNELNRYQTFKNPYEKSKFEAEVFLQKQFAGSEPVISVYRPSIVVGGQVIGEAQTMTTLYTFLKLLHFIRECCHDDFHDGKKLTRQYGIELRDSIYRIPMRVGANPNTRLNLVSVFYLADRILENLIKRPIRSQVFDVLSSTEVTIGQSRAVFCRVLGLEGIELVEKEDWKQKSRTPFEERFFRTTRVYEPYLYSSPVFDLKPAVTGSEMTHADTMSLETIARDFIVQLEKYVNRKVSPRLNALALSCLSAEEPERYLERFSENDFGDSFMKRIQFVKARVLFRVTGDRPVEKLVEFDCGSVRKCQELEKLNSDFGYEMNETIFQLIVSGALDPREALFQGRLKLLGDQAMCLKLGYIFSEHFRNINTRILEELAEA